MLVGWLLLVSAVGALPVVRISVNDTITRDYVPCTYKVSGSDLSGWAKIKLRGHTSAGLPKKQYSLNLMKSEAGGKRKESLLGLPKGRKWVLNGPYLDPTLIQNVLGFNLSRSIGRYAPRTAFFELWLSDTGASQFKGLYVLIEKITMGSHRVAIKRKKTKADTGYIFKFDKPDSDETPLLPEPLAEPESHLLLQEPDLEKLKNSTLAWVRNYIQQAAHSLTIPRAANGTAEFESYFELDSWVDHFILSELVRNVDAYRASSYFYRSEGGKLNAGPLWDLNLAFGSSNVYGAWQVEGWQYNRRYKEKFTETSVAPWWWRALLADPCFSTRLVTRWQSLRAGELHEDRVMETVRALQTEIREAVPQNTAVWGAPAFIEWCSTTPGLPSWEAALSRLERWLRGRLQWMDSHIPLLVRSKCPTRLSPPACSAVELSDRRQRSHGFAASFFDNRGGCLPQSDTVLPRPDPDYEQIYPQLNLTDTSDWPVAATVGGMSFGARFSSVLNVDVQTRYRFEVTHTGGPIRVTLDADQLVSTTGCTDNALTSTRWVNVSAGNHQVLVEYQSAQDTAHHPPRLELKLVKYAECSVSNNNTKPNANLQLVLKTGDCRITRNGTCVTSPGFPNEYANKEDCLISVNQSGALTAQPFDTEPRYDKLTLAGVAYSGSSGPIQHYTPAGSIVQWHSDGSQVAAGWELCWSYAPPTCGPQIPWAQFILPSAEPISSQSQIPQLEAQQSWPLSLHLASPQQQQIDFTLGKAVSSITHYQVTSSVGGGSSDPASWNLFVRLCPGCNWTKADSRSGVVFMHRLEPLVFPVTGINASQTAVAVRMQVTTVRSQQQPFAAWLTPMHLLQNCSLLYPLLPVVETGLLVEYFQDGGPAMVVRNEQSTETSTNRQWRMIRWTGWLRLLIDSRFDYQVQLGVRCTGLGDVRIWFSTDPVRSLTCTQLQQTTWFYVFGRRHGGLHFVRIEFMPVPGNITTAGVRVGLKLDNNQVGGVGADLPPQSWQPALPECYGFVQRVAVSGSLHLPFDRDNFFPGQSCTLLITGGNTTARYLRLSGTLGVLFDGHLRVFDGNSTAEERNLYDSAISTPTKGFVVASSKSDLTIQFDARSQRNAGVELMWWSEATTDFTPYDCSGVLNNCSLRGNCTYSGTCKCERGWQGQDCAATFDCSTLLDCAGHGVCFEHSKCSCEHGFKQPSCVSTLNCGPEDDCFGRGECYGDDKCACTSEWVGIDDTCSLPCGAFETTIHASSSPNSNEGADNLLDRRTDTKWLGFTGRDAPAGAAVVTLDSLAPRRVFAYTISSANDAPERDPARWVLEGSLDELSPWRYIDSQANVTFERLESQMFIVELGNAENEYARWRLILRLGSNQSNQMIQFSEFTMCTSPITAPPTTAPTTAVAVVIVSLRIGGLSVEDMTQPRIRLAFRQAVAASLGNVPVSVVTIVSVSSTRRAGVSVKFLVEQTSMAAATESASIFRETVSQGQFDQTLTDRISAAGTDVDTSSRVVSILAKRQSDPDSGDPTLVWVWPTVLVGFGAVFMGISVLGFLHRARQSTASSFEPLSMDSDENHQSIELVDASSGQRVSTSPDLCQTTKIVSDLELEESNHLLQEKQVLGGTPAP